MPVLDHLRMYRLPWSLTDNPIAWLEPTQACNLACDGCYRQNVKVHKPLKEVEEELHRPPFGHQIPLPSRRGEVESRRRQRHDASVTAQRLAISIATTADRPSRATSTPGRPA